MSKPSERKRQKQKQRERLVARRKHEGAKRRFYFEKFPSFEYRTNNAPEEFVSLVKRTVRELDFRDSRLFSVRETAFLKEIKKRPNVVMPMLMDAVEKRTIPALALSTMVGDRIIRMIPPDALRRWIPFHDVQFLMAGEKIIVDFRSLEQARTKNGIIYFSRYRPTVEIEERKLVVGWSKHAIERTCERIVSRWDSYLGLGDVFAFFHQCRRFDPCLLHNGRDIGFTFYDICAEGFFSGLIADQVLGRKPDGLCYYRVGYCPVVIESGFAKATTLLYPGYAGTPEYGLILRSGHPHLRRSEVIEKTSVMTRKTLEATGDFSLMKYFHDGGIAQVIESKDEFYLPHFESSRSALVE